MAKCMTSSSTMKDSSSTNGKKSSGELFNEQLSDNSTVSSKVLLCVCADSHLDLHTPDYPRMSIHPTHNENDIRMLKSFPILN